MGEWRQLLRGILADAVRAGCGCIPGCNRARLKRHVAWHDPLPLGVPAIVPLLRAPLWAKLASLGGMCLWQVGGDTFLHWCLPNVSACDALGAVAR